MKIGVTQIALGKMPLADVLRLCRDAGYEGVELFFTEGGDPDITASDDAVRAVGDRCREAGVAVASVIAWYKDRGNYLSVDPTRREAARRSLVRAIEIAHLLGAPTVLLHPGTVEADASYLEVWNTFVAAMGRVAPFAAEKGVTVGIENAWNRFMLSPREARQLIEEVDHPAVRLYLDTANTMLYGYPEQWLHDVGDLIAGVHFKDFARSRSCFVDLLEGDTAWPAVVSRLRSIGYNGYVLHEGAGDYEKQIEMARRMRRILDM